MIAVERVPTTQASKLYNLAEQLQDHYVRKDMASPTSTQPYGSQHSGMPLGFIESQMLLRLYAVPCPPSYNR